MFRWFSILACAALWGAGGQAADLGAPATIRGSLTAAAALAQVAAQTGHRIGGLAALGGGQQTFDVSDPAPGAIRAIAAQSGVIVARTGLYDWLALPAPQVPPPAPPEQQVDALRLLVRGAHYPVKAGTNQLDTPLRLVVELDVEAASDRDLASLSSLDPTSLQLHCDAGDDPLLLQDLYRPAVTQRQRMGQLGSLPFAMPDPGATTAALVGELWLFEALQPVGFQIQPDAVGSEVEADEIRLRVIQAGMLGGRWRVELGIRRPLVLGDPVPWIDAAVVTEQQTVVRPRELVVREAVVPRAAGEAPPEDDHPAEQVARLDFALAEGDQVQHLDLEIAKRQRPWRRVPFRIDGIALPDSPGAG